MADKVFRLEVITPERLAVDEDVTSVQLTATDGMMGVLARHAPLIAAAAVGPLRFRTAAGTARVLLVGDGFVEMVGDRLQVMGDFAEFPEEIDPERAKRSKERAETRLREHDTEVDAARAEASLRRALARLRMAGRGV